MAFTFFFRDNTVLEAAADLFVAATMGRSRVRVWDAGCAMGPEPYTLLILLAERMGRFSFENLRVDATDHDEGGDFGAIIETGRYPLEHLCRIPKELFAKYFAPVPGTSDIFEISPKLHSRINFKRHDLLTLAPPGDGYAMIVCKNVLLHFNEEQRTNVIAMFNESLAPGGLLVMEHTQKMPPQFAGQFVQARSEAQIYRKEEVAVKKAA
jgi:chemotaxis protein methyltransferase CheR